MKKIVFATNNNHKLTEIRQILSNEFNLLSLEDINCFEEIPETQPTIEGNALQKAQYIHEKYQIDCFADDTGLEVEALNNEPGVYSARYAGEEKNFKANMEKVLQKLSGIENRNAQFKTIIALIINRNEHLFEGIIKGKIINTPKGCGGFGYDPIFVPEGYNQTFAEMSPELKNKISHRGIATQKLIAFLNQLP